MGRAQQAGTSGSSPGVAWRGKPRADNNNKWVGSSLATKTDTTRAGPALAAQELLYAEAEAAEAGGCPPEVAAVVS